MRRFILLFFILINLTSFAQDKKESKHFTKRGKKGYADIIAGLDPNFVYFDKNINSLFSGYVYNLFFNKFYVGLFVEKKINATYANSPVIQRYLDGNLQFANGGVIAGGYVILTKTKNKKEEVKLLTRVNVSFKAGVGRIWMINPINFKSYNRFNYLTVFKPSIGIERPLAKFLAVGCGINYQFTLLSYIYFKNSEMSGPGAYFNIRLSLMNNDFMKRSVPAF
jgi:hypothetical protein